MADDGTTSIRGGCECALSSISTPCRERVHPCTVSQSVRMALHPPAQPHAVNSCQPVSSVTAVAAQGLTMCGWRVGTGGSWGRDSCSARSPSSLSAPRWAPGPAPTGVHLTERPSALERRGLPDGRVHTVCGTRRSDHPVSCRTHAQRSLQMEGVRAGSVVRVLTVSRTNYNTVAAAFPLGARTLLENLREHSQEVRDVMGIAVWRCGLSLSTQLHQCMLMLARTVRGCVTHPVHTHGEMQHPCDQPCQKARIDFRTTLDLPAVAPADGERALQGARAAAAAGCGAVAPR